ncbi:hypothetical protein [Pseudomonas sp. JUb52]|uniref:hypothetical protein n=1 Tax=Pseudomonas sp. JUb52 TaxID=2485127 RepID=UPI0010448901|nr:hypothetical protein [Pseudomonas sp. JUb52]TCQ85418.1 hypothetical protein EC839_110148 [Pseudomonas sp. JUb52]
MQTQIFAKTESELLPYLPAYKAILSATGYIGVNVDKESGAIEEGIVKPFSAEQKLVWLYALDRYRFFSKEGKEWFDNQSEIAEACNVSESCVKKFFRSLREANVIKSKGTRIGGHNSNSYIILRDLVLVQPDKAASKPSVSMQVERSEQVDSQVAPTPKQPVKDVEKVVEENDSFESLMESVNDNYSSYQAPVEQRPVYPFATAPAVAFNVRGEATEEMIAWCDKNGVSIRGLDGRTVFKLKGKNYTKSNEGYKEYTPAPYVSTAAKTLAEASGMEYMLNQFCNDEIDVPF